MVLGLLAGSLVGAAATGGYAHASWPILAGMTLGVFGYLAAPARKVIVALCGAAVAVVTAVATMAAIHYGSGSWPIIDEFRIAHYGSATHAIIRSTLIYCVLMGAPCLLVGVLVAATKRRHRRASQLAPGADEPRGSQ